MSRSTNKIAILSILLLLGVLIVAPSGFADEDVKRLSEPVAETATHEVFGALLPNQGTPLGLEELIGNSEKYQDQEVLVATRIAKVCQKKGCFFVATEGAATARITFKDYEFFIPTDAGGKHVVLLGIFSRTTESEQEAEHFAADLGETVTSDPVQAPYSIVASAVQIPKS